MLEKITDFLENKLSMPMARLAEQRHLRAIRDGIIATLPLIIVGSFFLIIAFPPLPDSWGITQYLKENASTILLPYRMTMYIMTMYATWGIGYSLAKSYKLDGVTGGILAAIAFMMTIVPQVVEGMGFVMPMGNMGGGGMFVGIVVSIFAVEVLRFTTTKNFRIKMPEQVPPSVARSFEALTPTAIVILFMGVVSYFLKFDWHGFIAKVVDPLVSASDTLPSVLILVFLITLFWSFGIHGVSIIGSLARPLWLQLLDQNTAAVAAGQTATGIAAEPFYQWFIWVGGSGATIGLVILMATICKSKYGKSLGRTALVPGIFNINEPVIFGAPIVLNPILIIPFVITPMVSAIVAWFAMSFDLVNKVTVTAPWTLPGPIGAFLATGGDWRASVLNIICIIISLIIYYPFVKMYDKKLLAEETTGEGNII
ncbi:PTS sugar transporter subunit IIC [Clostridium sardiniense]|uniref:Permease IIC component n=1 Tax=Clostridium sardiniense TaxID=29369 RepID=A0ABS7KT55_CLOSR|nr:PTS sugar transporter subunit IIC [Clostridium sardiniense]MBM7833126.1 PTS system cellobiose-specific IIC component [Clostridium sardiniense]MBY0753991.1 PTS sugar transporter subunit IIC [Clostridium sardiniense]MDQ0459493.1 PTS system cellobiose-specific IIC component [Clostridium sardiniense]